MGFEGNDSEDIGEVGHVLLGHRIKEILGVLRCGVQEQEEEVGEEEEMMGMEIWNFDK